MKVIGICGSLREESFNKRVLKYASHLLPRGAEFKIIDIKAPLYDDDIDISEKLINIQKEIKSADYVIIVTPEYNYGIPGGLKNFLDWMSVEPEYPFEGKKVAIMSASMGMLGGARVQYQLRQVLLSLDANVVQHPEVFIGNAHEKFKGEEFTDEKGKKSIQKLMDALLM